MAVTKMKKLLNAQEPWEKALGTTIEDAKAQYILLTEREREVAGYIADGVKNRVMAEKMGISVKTLDIHRANIFRKFNTKTTVNVAKVVYALRIDGSIDEVGYSTES